MISITYTRDVILSETTADAAGANRTELTLAGELTHEFTIAPDDPIDILALNPNECPQNSCGNAPIEGSNMKVESIDCEFDSFTELSDSQLPEAAQYRPGLAWTLTFRGTHWEDWVVQAIHQQNIEKWGDKSLFERLQSFSNLNISADDSKRIDVTLNRIQDIDEFDRPLCSFKNQESYIEFLHRVDDLLWEDVPLPDGRDLDAIEWGTTPPSGLEADS